jgi:hypothetical protein
MIRGTLLGAVHHPNDWMIAQMEIEVDLDDIKPRFCVIKR